MRAAVTQLETRLGPTDLLVASAGIGMETPAHLFRGEDFAAQIRVNLIGVGNTLDAILPGMCRRERGHVAVLSSMASYRGLPRMAGYCASKAGVNSLLDALRVELRPMGITVTTICPGWIRTPLTSPLQLPDTDMMEVDEAVRRIVAALRVQTVYRVPGRNRLAGASAPLHAEIDQRLVDPPLGPQDEEVSRSWNRCFITCRTGPCGYLPDQRWSLEYEIVAQMTQAEYLQLLLGNWRRFGNMVFRPVCEACRACRSLRVVVPQFRPDRSQRRCRQSNEGVIELRIGEPSVNRTKLALYDRYHAFQADHKGWPEHPCATVPATPIRLFNIRFRSRSGAITSRASWLASATSMSCPERNPKSEIRNPKEIPRTKMKIRNQRIGRFRTLVIRI